MLISRLMTGTTRDAVADALMALGTHSRNSRGEIDLPWFPDGTGRTVVTTTAEFGRRLRLGTGVSSPDSASYSPLSPELRTAQAFFDPKTRSMVFFTDRIAPGREKAVIAHEMVHKFGRSLLDRRTHLEPLLAALKAWSKHASGSQERTIHDFALDHSRAYLKKRPSIVDEEFLAYALEAAVNLGVTPDEQAAIDRAGGWLARSQQVMQRLARAALDHEEAHLSVTDCVAIAYALADMDWRMSSLYAAPVAPQESGQEQQGQAPLGLHSALRHYLAQSGVVIASASTWAEHLRMLVNRGEIKSEELAWSGLQEYLKLAGSAQISRHDVMSYLAIAGEVKEVVLLNGAGMVAAYQSILDEHGFAGYTARLIEDEDDVDQWSIDIDNASGQPVALEALPTDLQMALRRIRTQRTKYQAYTTYPVEHGSGQYRELLLLLTPQMREHFEHIQVRRNEQAPAGSAYHARYVRAGSSFLVSGSGATAGMAMGAALLKLQQHEGLQQHYQHYRSHHFSQPNILAHARVLDAVGQGARRFLFVNEIQSDWAQSIRRQRLEAGQPLGYEVAPFVGGTQAWVTLMLKSLLLRAAHEGYDGLAMASGMQVARAMQMPIDVCALSFSRLGPGQVSIALCLAGQHTYLPAEFYQLEELPAMFGREMADQITRDLEDGLTQGNYHHIELTLPAHGMQKFYDQIVPGCLRRLLQKIKGPSLQRCELDFPDTRDTSVDPADGNLYVPIDDAFRFRLVSSGLPLFRQQSGDRAIRNEAFSRWFGASRVVDDHGAPKVLYHSTFGDFSEFSRSADVGYHFGSAHVAHARVKEAAKARGWRGDKRMSGLNVMPVYLSIQHPKQLSEDPRAWQPEYVLNMIPEVDEADRLSVLALDEAALEAARQEAAELMAGEERKRYCRVVPIKYEWQRALPDKLELLPGVWDRLLDRARKPVYAALVAAIERAGYDGLSYVNQYEGRRGEHRRRADNPENLCFVAFRPEQIKSALGNDGQFDASSPDILHSQAQPRDSRLEAAPVVPGALPHPFDGVTRESFLGRPIITKAGNARDLRPSAGASLALSPMEPFSVASGMPGLMARYGEHGVAVYDLHRGTGDALEPIASYSFGDTLVVSSTYRRLGIGQEMVYQWRSRYPQVPAARTRTRASQALMEKVWARIESEMRLIRYPSSGPLPGDAAAALEGAAFLSWMSRGGLRDARGRATVLYHGSKTPDGLTEFVPGGPEGARRCGDAYGVASYFTTSPSEASAFAGSGGAVFPVYIRGQIFDLDAPLSLPMQAQFTQLAERVLLPSDKARFDVGRECRIFGAHELDDAREFFDSQRKNWEQFGDGMCRARPEVVPSKAGGFNVEFTNFDAQVQIETPEQAAILLKIAGHEVLRELGYDGMRMSRDAGAAGSSREPGGVQWVVMFNTLGTIKSATGNDGRFDPLNPSILCSMAWTDPAIEPVMDEDENEGFPATQPRPAHAG